jgi:hypothetical protein
MKFQDLQEMGTFARFFLEMVAMFLPVAVCALFKRNLEGEDDHD